MSAEQNIPPRLATRLIERLGNSKEVSNVLGDLHELYLRRIEESGMTKAKLLYWRDILSVLMHRAVKKDNQTQSKNSMELFYNYFKVASRSLIRQKGHTAINIVGLSVGFAFSLLIFLYVAHELSYDNFHKKGDRIYLLPMTWHFNGTDLPTGANCSVGGPFMKQNFPEVEEYVRISNSSVSFYKNEEAVKEARILYADSSFFNVFTFPLLMGDARTALVEPLSIVLTRSTAEKYFGLSWETQNLVGKTMTGTNNKSYLITGVTEDSPTNSHLQYNAIISFSTLRVSRVQPKWDNSEFYTYVLLNDHADANSIVKQLPDKMEAAFDKEARAVIELDLVLLQNLYLNNQKYSVPNTSNIMYVRIFSFAAILVLLIATVNYVNMATARSMERALEVGVRKVMGAQRAQLFYQFLSESFIITSLSMVLAITMAWLVLPVFNEFAGKSLSFDRLLTGQNVIIVLGMALAISFLSGIYPALFVSGYMPAKVLKGKLKDSVQGIRLRKTLVTGQFMISILLIICTLMVSSQINFIRNKNLGFDKDQLVSLSLDSLARTRLDVFKNNMLANTSVTSLAASYQLPTNITHQTALSLANESDAERKLMTAICVDSEFSKTIGLQVMSGTNFTANIEKTSDTWEILLNESAANFFGWSPEDAIGKELRVWQEPGIVKGVVQDFHFSSLHNPIAPLVMFSGKGGPNYSNMLVKVSGTPQEITSLLESTWKKTNPDSPFILTFLDEQYETLYKKDTQLRSIINIFACLAILISILGLFGLASYSILQRTRELGVRKVLGASVSNLVSLVSNSFIRLVLVAFVLAVPVSWYLMDQWLSGFAYHIPFSWWIVIGSGAGTVVLAMLTVVYHALEVTRLNPSQTLRAQ